MLWKQLVMYAVGLLLVYLGIRKKYEPAILIPLGFGAILVNLPDSASANGIIAWLFEVGIETSEAMPLILFVGIGAMIDFTPLMKHPSLFFCGLFAQIGIFLAIFISKMAGFSLLDSVSIGIIGAADGPTAIFVSRTLKSRYAGQIALAAYSYISLVPLIQPAIARILTSRNERMIRTYNPTEDKIISRPIRIAFPIAVTFISGFISPKSAELVGFIMFGNLIRECGVLENLAETARTTLTNIITIFLGLTISFTLKADDFVQADTLLILLIGLLSFVFDTVGGIIFVKLFNVFAKRKLNPLIGMSGISAFPIATHVVQKIAMEEDDSNVIIMEAAGANVAGQICSAVAGGVLLNAMMK